jgi:hypothetical protein
VSVLEQVALAPMPPVNAQRIAVAMGTVPVLNNSRRCYGHQRPCETRCLGIGNDIAEPTQEITPIEIIQEYLSPVDSPHDDVMHGSRGVYTSFSRHIKLVSQSARTWKPKIRGTSLKFPLSFGIAIGIFLWFEKKSMTATTGL